MRNENPEPRTPINYFGKGRDHIISADSSEVAQFEKDWREWEAKNPNDPTGEIALEKWEKEQRQIEIDEESPDNFQQPRTQQKSERSTKPFKPLPEDWTTNKMRLELDQHSIDKLKKYASFKRRRPRDIIAHLIEQYCNISG